MPGLVCNKHQRQRASSNELSRFFSQKAIATVARADEMICNSHLYDYCCVRFAQRNSGAVFYAFRIDFVVGGGGRRVVGIVLVLAGVVVVVLLQFSVQMCVESL